MTNTQKTKKTFPNLEDQHVPLNTLLDCTDWGALFKISSVHVTTVTALKGKKKSGEFKTFTYNHIKYVTVHEYATNIEKLKSKCTD